MLIIVAGIVKYLWDKRRGGGNTNALVWTIVVGAVLAAPALIIPILLAAIDVVVNAVVKVIAGVFWRSAGALTAQDAPSLLSPENASQIKEEPVARSDKDEVAEVFLYDLTEMTGKKAQQQRTQVIMTVEMRRGTLISLIIATFPALMVMGLLWPFLNVYATLGGVVVFGAILFFLMHRQRRGLQLSQWRGWAAFIAAVLPHPVPGLSGSEGKWAVRAPAGAGPGRVMIATNKTQREAPSTFLSCIIAGQAPPAGLEPATYGLEGRCSIH